MTICAHSHNRVDNPESKRKKKLKNDPLALTSFTQNV